MAALVVKRLEDAIRDGDPIRAVIRETGANQDGRTPTITTPDAEAQKRLIQQCYSLAGLDPLETNMFEAHGTGTSVGDPIEAKAVGQTLGANRPLSKPVYMASVKTNIGHTEATSGLASLIKIAMSFQHKQIAPHINFEKINPDIDLRNLSLQVRNISVGVSVTDSSTDSLQPPTLALFGCPSCFGEQLWLWRYKHTCYS